jgi:hypoxanthine-DNA glycosylase
MAPVAAPDTTILILGTMPGDRSIRQAEYYAHPQNKFWKIISTATNNALPKTYLEKKDLLLKYKIGIWDLLDKANRKGSLDNAIRGQEPNDLDGFIDKHPHLKVIAFNGKTAKALFGKYFNKRESIRYVCLPSTSPANTNIGFDNICALWRKILTLTDD